MRDAVPGAFALASLVMVFVLATRLARRLGYPLAAGAGATVVAFGLGAAARGAARRRRRWRCSRGASGLGAFARTLGASGLFTAIVVALAAAGAFELGRRRFGPAAGPALGGLALVALRGRAVRAGLLARRAGWPRCSPRW